MLKAVFQKFGVFEGATSSIEFVGRVMGLFIISGGGAATATAAKAAPWLESFLGAFGALAYVLLFFAGAFITGLLMTLFRFANKILAESEYSKNLVQKSTSINPLNNTFENEIIDVEDLRLPPGMMHRNKHFNGCIFRGPGVIYIAGGGTFSHIGFINSGSILPIPNPVYIIGMTTFYNCTFVNCKFYDVQFAVSGDQARETYAGFKTHFAGDEGTEKMDATVARDMEKEV